MAPNIDRSEPQPPAPTGDGTARRVGQEELSHLSDIVMTVIDIPNPGEWGLFITTRVAPGLPRGEGLTIRVRSGASREEVTREAMTMAKAMKAKERVAVYLHQPDLFDRQRFEADGIEVIDTPPDAIRNYLALNAMTRTR